MKTFKYNLALTGLILVTLGLPAGGLYIGIIVMKMSQTGVIIIVASIVAALILFRPLWVLTARLRNEAEHDEFGRSKSKGKYELLSKKDRDAIDLQKTADMERILDSTALAKLTHPGSRNPEKDLEAMQGLAPVKDKCLELAARMELDRSMGKKGGETLSGRHMAFLGAPGTGKTTVARIMTGFLYRNKIIKQNRCVEVDGNFLKCGADTATKTTLVVQQAFGGVLFIDEAYALTESGDSAGAMAVATLIKMMEDSRSRFVLILAGYTDAMTDMIRTNPGFESRVKEFIEFPDYSNGEMYGIFKKMAGQSGFSVDGEAESNFMERMGAERKLPGFANGRTARNILDDSIDRHALNLKKKVIPSSQRLVITKEDISVTPKRRLI